MNPRTSVSPRAPWLSGAAIALAVVWICDLASIAGPVIEAESGNPLASAVWVFLTALAAVGAALWLLAAGHVLKRLGGSSRVRALLGSAPVGLPLAWWFLELSSGARVSEWTWVWPARVLGVAAILVGTAVGLTWCARPRMTTAFLLLVAIGCAWWADGHLVDPKSYPAFHHAARLFIVVAAVLFGRQWPAGGGAVSGSASMAAAPVLLLVASAGIFPGDDPWARRVLLAWAPIGGELVRAVTEAESGALTVTDEARDAVAPLAPAPPATLDHVFPGRKDFNVVLITIDTVRADHLSLYGYSKPTSPALDELAAESVVFDRAYAQYPSSPFSFLSFLTGRYATSVADGAGQPDADRPVLGSLAEDGRRIVGVTPLGRKYVTKNFPYLTKLLESQPPMLEALGVPTVADTSTVLERGKQRIAASGTDRHLAWIHLFDPHAPYVAHSNTGSLPATAVTDDDVTRYDGEIAQTDTQLALFFDWLRARDDWDRTVVIVHSDHGEGLGDHGAAFHGGSVHEEQIRVPLIVRIPGVGARRVASPVELVDLLPTLEELLGTTRTEGVHGHSLLGYFAPETGPYSLPTPAGVAFSQAFFNRRPGSEALITDRWKLIRDLESGTEHLYDLEADPGERKDLALDPPDVIDQLRALVGAFRERAEGREAWKSGDGPTVGTPVASLLGPDGAVILATQPDAASDAVRLALDPELPESMRMRLTRLVVLIRPDLAPDLLRRAVRTASLDYRALCARWAGLVEGADDTIDRLIDSPNPRVAAAALASRAIRGDEAALDRLVELPTSTEVMLESWRILAAARHGDARASSAIPALVESADLSDAEILIGAWELARTTPKLDLHASLYLRLTFVPGAVLDRWAIGLRLLEDPVDQILPLLRSLIVSKDGALGTALARHLEARGKGEWWPKLVAIKALMTQAHAAAARKQAAPAAQALEAADDIVLEQRVPDWGVFIERHVLHAYAPMLPEPEVWVDVHPKPIVAMLQRLQATTRGAKKRMRIVDAQVVAPDVLEPGVLVRVDCQLGPDGGTLAGGVQIFGATLVVQTVDHRRGLIESRTLPITGVGARPGERFSVPFVWTAAGRGNTAWIHFSITTQKHGPVGQKAKKVELRGAPPLQHSGINPRAFVSMTTAALLGVRPVNGIARRPRTGSAFKFLVGGHFYGSRNGPHPARTLRDAIDRLSRSGADFFVTCGDLFWQLGDDSLAETVKVTRQLGMPLYNAPGNHGLSDRADYVRRLGPTHGVFRHGNSLFVLLDTEDDPWNLTGPQLQFLRLAARWAKEQDDLDNVFLFAHKVLFADKPEYESTIGKRLNAREKFSGRMNFVEDIEPILVDLAQRHPVYWFSGDVGVPPHSRTLFHEVDPKTGITYVATGIGDLPRDLVVEVSIDDAGKATLRPIALDPETKVQPLQAYGNAAWK